MRYMILVGMMIITLVAKSALVSETPRLLPVYMVLGQKLAMIFVVISIQKPGQACYLNLPAFLRESSSVCIVIHCYKVPKFGRRF